MNDGVDYVVRCGNKEADLGCQIDMNLPNVASTPKKYHPWRLKFSICGTNFAVSLVMAIIEIILEKINLYLFV